MMHAPTAKPCEPGCVIKPPHAKAGQAAPRGACCFVEWLAARGVWDAPRLAHPSASRSQRVEVSVDGAPSAAGQILDDPIDIWRDPPGAWPPPMCRYPPSVHTFTCHGGRGGDRPVLPDRDQTATDVPAVVERLSIFLF